MRQGSLLVLFLEYCTLTECKKYHLNTLTPGFAMDPKISVLFPVGNREIYLREAIESVLAQSFTDFEFLIIKDGLPPNVESIIDSYDDQRIRAIRLPINLGLSTALNTGLRVARAPYLVMMDSDDVSMPDRFARQYDYMERNPGVTVCGSNFIKVFSDGKRYPHRYPETDALIKARMILVDSAIHNPTVICRTDFVRKYRLQYDGNFPRNQDYRFYVEMIRNGATFYCLQEELLLYRRHDDNLTNDVDDIEEEKRRIREMILPLYFPQLTGEEIGFLLRLFYRKSSFTVFEGGYCLAIVNKALRENQSVRGEDRSELRSILLRSADALIKAFNRTL